ncbi:UNVERIFIED_CONTAM: hypothetical protein FKN15_053464 [Acipenser sinensis]
MACAEISVCDNAKEFLQLDFKAASNLPVTKRKSFNASSSPCESARCMFLKYNEEGLFQQNLFNLQIYNVLGFLWCMNFVLALGQCTMAGAFASYYWAFNKPGDLPYFPVASSFLRTLRTSAITVCIVCFIDLFSGVLAFFFFSGRIEMPGETFSASSLNYYWVPIITVVVGSYMIAKGFFSVYSMCVDTLFLCFLLCGGLKCYVELCSALWWGDSVELLSAVWSSEVLCGALQCSVVGGQCGALQCCVVGGQCGAPQCCVVVGQCGALQCCVVVGQCGAPQCCVVVGQCGASQCCVVVGQCGAPQCCVVVGQCGALQCCVVGGQCGAPQCCVEL